MKDVYDACDRGRKLFISKEFKETIRCSFASVNAEKLPENSHYILYDDRKNLIEEMRTSSNQIIWGRRGTGKTHLLKAFVQRINDDCNLPEIALYISCDRIAQDTPPAELTFPDAIKEAKYFARESYKEFMNDLVAQLVDEFETLLIYKSAAISTDLTIDEILGRVNQKLDHLMSCCFYGVQRTIKTTATAKYIETKTNSGERAIGLDLGTDKRSFWAKLKAKFHRASMSKAENTMEKNETTQYQYSLLAIKHAITDLINEMQVSCLYICIDELWLIDAKNSAVKFQPYFLDDIRQTLNGQSKIGVKIASMRETTHLNSKTSAEESFGMQSGHDIYELAYLDVIQNKNGDLYRKFEDILMKRINYFANEDAEYPGDFIINALFKDKRHFKSLVELSHGIPRNFLNIINTCLRKINYNLSEKFIHTYLISDAVMEVYSKEHRSNLSLFNCDSLYEKIKDYVIKTDHYFFIISNNNDKRLQNEISILLYYQIIHRIPSDETPLNIMDRYKAFYLDLGMFLFVVKEKNIDRYSELLEKFELKLPEDLKSCYHKYILNLTETENVVVDCPYCGQQFQKTQPVYAKFKVCPHCGN